MNNSRQQSREFHRLLTQVGVPLSEDWNPLQCSQATNAWLRESGASEQEMLRVTLSKFVRTSSSLSEEVYNALAYLRVLRA